MNIEEIKEMMEQEQEKIYEYIRSKETLSNREIDVLVDRYVMQNRPSVNIHSKLPTSDKYPLSYSTNIEDAWTVAEKLRKQGEFNIGNDSTEWIAEMYTFKGSDIDKYVDISHQSASMAICLVALKLNGITI